MHRLVTCLALPFWLFPGHPAESQQRTAYEPPPVVRADTVLPPNLLRSGHHRVLPDWVIAQDNLVVEIESDYGRYRVHSLAMVETRVREIQTLAQAISQLDRADRALADEMRGQLQVGGESVVGILTSPFDTTSQLIDQTSEKVDQTFEELNQIARPGARQPGGVAAPRSPPARTDPVLDAYRRSIASQLDLDVYSSNPSVQAFLDRAAEARIQGQRRAGTVSVTLPHAEVRVAGGRVDAAVRSMVARDTDAELSRYASDSLRSMDIDADVVEAFVGQPALSPRHKIAITEYLRFLKGVGNRGAVLRAASATATEGEAANLVRLVRMLAAYHERHSPLIEFSSHDPLPLARTAGGGAVVALPVDVVYWHRGTDQLFTALADRLPEPGITGVDVLVGGVATPVAVAELRRRGFEARDRFLFRR